MYILFRIQNAPNVNNVIQHLTNLQKQKLHVFLSWQEKKFNTNQKHELKKVFCGHIKAV